jgi:hypothetical protein
MDRGESCHYFKCIECDSQQIDIGNFFGRVKEMIASNEKIACDECGGKTFHYAEEVRYGYEEPKKIIHEHKYSVAKADYMKSEKYQKEILNPSINSIDKKYSPQGNNILGLPDNNYKVRGKMVGFLVLLVASLFVYLYIFS